MESGAFNIKTVKIGLDQSYEWGTVETKFGKVKKYAVVDYFWHGELWQRIADAMKGFQMRQTAISFYKGAIIDEKERTVKVKGDFIREFVADRHNFLWRAFFRCPKDVQPKFLTIGPMVKVPNIAGDNDSLNFYVNGQNVNSLLSNPDEQSESEEQFGR